MAYSPWLGILTAIFEIAAAFWALRLPGRKSVLRPIALTQFLLAGYQLMEVIICLGPEAQRPVLSRFAFLDITWLPPVSLVLIANLLPHTPRWLRHFTRGALALAALFSFWIVVDTRFITGTICAFMYAGYRYVEPYFHFYGAYYEITQMSMIFIPAALIASQRDESVRRNLADLMIGALLFVIPSLFLAAVKPLVFDMALPSLMCHFALFYAIFLVRISRRELVSAPVTASALAPSPVKAP